MLTTAAAFTLDESSSSNRKNETYDSESKIREMFGFLCKELDEFYPTEEERLKRFGIRVWADIPKPMPFYGAPGTGDCFCKFSEYFLKCEFELWHKLYPVSYPSEQEELYRFRVFKENYSLLGSMAFMQYMMHHQSRLGLGSYADRTFDEMKRLEKEEEEEEEEEKDDEDEEEEEQQENATCFQF